MRVVAKVVTVVNNVAVVGVDLVSDITAGVVVVVAASGAATAVVGGIGGNVVVAVKSFVTVDGLYYGL